MPRDQRIETILAAWYDLVTCELSEKARFRDQRDKLLDSVIAGTRSCRQELLEALGPRFHEYKVARRKEHQEKMAQIPRQP